MAVEITLGGNGAWSGGSGELKTYAVDEESTPLNATDTGGAVPEIRFEVDEDEGGDWRLLYATPITLGDDSNGLTSGTITGVSSTDGAVAVTVESPLAALVPEQQIPPHVGTLATAIEDLFAMVDVLIPISYDPAINAETTPVAMQGWYGSPWEWVKQLCVSHSIEVSVIGTGIAVRGVRKREVETETDQRIDETIARGPMALNVDVVRYKNTYKADAMVYPSGGWSDELEVYSVDADETIDVEIPVDVSLISIDQPTCVSFVPMNYNGPSVYTVTGDDGLPVPPAMWAQFGGSVSVAIGQDTKTIMLRIVGPSLQQYAPYSISVNSGLSDTYSSLRLRGEGVHFTRDVRRFATGADPSIARQEVGATVDNPTVQTDAQFARLVLSACRQFSMSTHTVSATALTGNRKGEPGLVRHLTFGEFEAARPDPYTFQDFKTEFAGKTFRQIRDALRAESTPQDSFENQAFGNVVGSVVRRGNAYFRVRHATIEPTGVAWEAEADTTFAQIKAAHSGKSFQQLKNERAGLTFAEIALQPLRGA